MIGLGTIINCIAIAAGSSLGVFLKGGLPRRFETTIMQALGLCTFFIGIGGAVSGLLTIADGSIATQHTMLLVLSMVLGALIGEALNIEQRLTDFGDLCQARFAAERAITASSRASSPRRCCSASARWRSSVRLRTA